MSRLRMGITRTIGQLMAHGSSPCFLIARDAPSKDLSKGFVALHGIKGRMSFYPKRPASYNMYTWAPESMYGHPLVLLLFFSYSW